MALMKVSITVSNEGLQLLRMALSALALSAQTLDADITVQVGQQLAADEAATAPPNGAGKAHTNGAGKAPHAPS